VNHVAPFVLTHALLPKLRTSRGRIVHVASDSHRRVTTLSLPDDLVRTTPFSARESSLLYAQSKLLGVLFTKALARRLAGTGVVTNSCCPGLNVTGLGRESRVFAALATVLGAMGAFSPASGARIVVRLAADPDLGSTNGAHFSRGGDVKADTALVADVALQERLWADTASLPAVSRLGDFP
jgi:NAD(P)-dependent dehydrogenase (short-subunit alcohol dehydrogenase family)